MPTLRCCISVGTIRVCVRVVCVCVRVCGVVPFAVDFSLSQIGKMVLALLDRGGCCCCCLLQPKGKTQQTETSRTTTTFDTRHAHLYNTQSILVCHIICVIIMSHALCVLNKRGGRKRTREKGGKPENNNNNMMEIHTSKPSIKTRLTIERWI